MSEDSGALGGLLDLMGENNVPENVKHVGEVMSNFDHEIDRDVEEQLKEGNCIADYPAWNFHGTVWHDGTNFQCMIKRYQQHVATLELPTLEGIMQEASERWGYD